VDSNTTTLNPWSWNNEVNMLYIDQPDQVGLSWDVLKNGTQDLTDPDGNVTISDFSKGVPKQNDTFLVGTFPSQNLNSSANGTTNAARALWHFAQVWFQTFPDYKPNDDRISIWTESYGGRYGPAFTSFFEEQNMKIENSTWTEKGETYFIHLDTLGIINGCIDLQIQEPSYPHMAFNNTYGLQTINESVYDAAMLAYTKKGGVRDLINTCRQLAAEGDPTNQGNNVTVNLACEAANEATSGVEVPYIEYSGKNYYDIAAIDLDPFPPSYYVGYLNRPHVQAALGAPVNYTNPGGNAAYYAFQTTGDYARGGFLEDLAYILDSGIKVAMVYGDRDYACNWIGGEDVSLAVAYSQASKFHSAGYEDIQVNSSYVGGLVRQHGNFSFSRVFQSGHEVPAYQPEAAYQIFQRAMFNTDIATGKISTTKNNSYSSTGPSSTWQIKNDVLKGPEPVCYTLALGSTCTNDQTESVMNGTALIHDYIVIDKNSNTFFPGVGNNETSSGGGGSGGTATTSGPSAASPSKTGAGSILVPHFSVCTLVLALCVFAGYLV
jgi:carboxypeptidase C (cathepsin A)